MINKLIRVVSFPVSIFFVVGGVFLIGSTNQIYSIFSGASAILLGIVFFSFSVTGKKSLKGLFSIFSND